MAFDTESYLMGLQNGGGSGGGEPAEYLKSIEKDEINKEVTIKDKQDNETEFPYVEDTADLDVSNIAESLSGASTKQSEVNVENVNAIKTLEARALVADIVQCYDRGTDTTKTDIVHYDLTDLSIGSSVMAIIDETHEDRTSYYKVKLSGGSKVFEYQGSEKAQGVDDVTITRDENGKLIVKDNGLTVEKFNASAVSTDIGSTPSDEKLPTEKAVHDFAVDKAEIVQIESESDIPATLDVKNLYSITQDINVHTDTAGDKFVEVDCIESTGTQYIQVGFKGNQDTKYELDLMQTALGGYPIGSGDGWLNAMTGYYYNGEGTSERYTCYGNQRLQSTWLKNTINQRHKIMQDKNKVYLDGALKGTMTANTFQSNSEITLSAYDNNGVVSSWSKIKLYGFKLWDNDTLIRDMIPVKRVRDNELGLLDLENDVFYSNKGTGKFVSGAIKGFIKGLYKPENNALVRLVDENEIVRQIENNRISSITTSLTTPKFSIDTLRAIEYGNLINLNMQVQFAADISVAANVNCGEIRYNGKTIKGMSALQVFDRTTAVRVGTLMTGYSNSQWFLVAEKAITAGSNYFITGTIDV